MSKLKLGSAIRLQIDAAVNQAKDERRQRLLSQRLELARAGMIAFQRKQVADAAKAYIAYLRLLEESKNVGEGAMMPTQFDQRKEMVELLMLSGIYWDLARIFDRTHSKEKQADFYHYLEKYIIFSKGMPFQHLCAESLRKYIAYEKPAHLRNFKDAYRLLGKSRCFVATSLLDVTRPTTILTLQTWRDQVLKQSFLGRRFVSWYYRHSKKAALKIDLAPSLFRGFLGKLLNGLAACVQFFLVDQSTDTGRSKDKLTVRKTRP